MLGLVSVSAESGSAVFRLPPSPNVGNARGVVHGGAIASLCDCAIGTAMRSALKPGDVVATIELKVNYMAPGQGELEARSRVLHLGGTTAVGEVEIYGEAGQKLVAKAMATFAVKRGAAVPRPGAVTAMDPEFDGPHAN